MYMENVFATLSAALNIQDHAKFLEKKHANLQSINTSGSLKWKLL